MSYDIVRFISPEHAAKLSTAELKQLAGLYVDEAFLGDIERKTLIETMNDYAVVYNELVKR